MVLYTRSDIWNVPIQNISCKSSISIDTEKEITVVYADIHLSEYTLLKNSFIFINTAKHIGMNRMIFSIGFGLTYNVKLTSNIDHSPNTFDNGFIFVPIL